MDFETRKTLWLALSELYLDTEISESTLCSVVKTAKKNNVSFETLYKINKEEVFPVLYMNCFAVTGVWTGFDKNWLIEKIATSLKKRNKFIKKINTLKFILFSSCISNTLKKLKSLFNKSVCSTSQV